MGCYMTRRVKKPENHETGALFSSHGVVIITDNYRNLPKTNPNPNSDAKFNHTPNPNSKP